MLELLNNSKDKLITNVIVYLHVRTAIELFYHKRPINQPKSRTTSGYKSFVILINISYYQINI